MAGPTVNTNPRVSVLVCTRNRKENVVPTIRSILSSSYRNLEIVLLDQSDRPVTREALANLGDPGRTVEFTSRMGPKPMRVHATAGGIGGQLLFHEVHHRAQVMAMLRQAGVAAQNLDYSVLIWERTPLD